MLWYRIALIGYMLNSIYIDCIVIYIALAVRVLINIMRHITNNMLSVLSHRYAQLEHYLLS